MRFIVLAGGDGIPGAIIVVAALVGLAVEIPVIRKLCSEGPASSPPTGRPVNAAGGSPAVRR